MIVNIQYILDKEEIVKLDLQWLVMYALFRCFLFVQWICIHWNNSICAVPAGDERQTFGGGGTVV